MHADDTSISSSSENPLQLLLEDFKRELEGIMNWLIENDALKITELFPNNYMKLNEDKYHLMILVQRGVMKQQSK